MSSQCSTLIVFDCENQVMNHPKKIYCLLLAVLSIVGTTGAVDAQDNVGFDRELLKVQDQLLLRSGAVLKGRIADVPKEKTEPVSFRSTSGESMLVDPKLIAKVEKIDSVSRRYNDAVEKMKDDVQSHRDMIAWCEEQERGRSRFRNQILFHRNRILVFEPNDRSARTKLGYTFLKDENRWVDEDQFWATQGYSKQGSRWSSNLHQQTQQQLDSGDAQLGTKRKKFGTWRRNRRRMSLQEAVDSLVAIADPQLMPFIYEEFAKAKDPDLRGIYIEVFASARPTTSSAITGLVTAVMDERSDIALDYLRHDDFNKRTVATFLTRFLASKNNATVNRAGYALGELGSTNAILALGKALETKHQVVAASNNSGAQRVRGNAGGDSFSFGGQQARSRVFQNEDVSDALRKITGQDFGYSEQAYQKWYVQNYTHVGLKARR